MKIMNKRVVLFSLSLIVMLLIGSFIVSALSTESFVTGVQDFFKPILKAVFGEETNIFEQLLFALMIIAAVYFALDKVDFFANNQFALWTITIVVAILAVRFIATQKLIELLFFPQGVLGVALITIIPFAIYFFFVEYGLEGPRNRVLRKIAWVVYAVVFGMLWYKSFVTTTTNYLFGIIPLGTTTTVKEWGYFYLIAAILSILLMLIDGTIQNAIRKSRAETVRGVHESRIRASLTEQRAKLEKQRAEGTITKDDYNTLDRELKKQEKQYGLR